MGHIKNDDQSISLRIKKSKIKINASLSAICSKLDIIPIKLISRFESTSQSIPIEQEKFLVKLYKDKSSPDGFNLIVQPEPDSSYIRNIKKLKLDQTQLKKEILDYAAKTMNKSYANNITSRYNELMGIFYSFK